MYPVLFHIGTYPVYAFGAMLGLSLLAGYQLCVRHARRDGLSGDVAGNAFLLAAVTGLVGARLAYALADPEGWEDGGGLLDIQSGGLMGWGGLLAGGIAAAIYLKLKRASLPAFSDALAPAVAAGFSLSRLGSYLYGSEFGKPLPEGSDGLLAKLGTYRRWGEALSQDGLHGPPALLHHLDRSLVARDAAASLPTHPVQLYDLLLGLLLLGLCVLWRRRRRYPGQVGLRLSVGFAVARFATGYLRDDPDRGLAFGFTHTQLFCIALLAGAGLLWSARRGARDDAPAA